MPVSFRLRPRDPPGRPWRIGATMVRMKQTTGVLRAHDVRVRIGSRDLLPPTSRRCGIGDVVVALGPPGPAATALALALAGRLRLDEGTVTLGDSGDPNTLQYAVALVDLPEVTDPDPGIPVRTVVAEDLALAGRRASRRTAQRWLADHGADDAAAGPVRDLDGALRLRLLTDLAGYRPGVTHLVLAAPERHGLPPATWRALAERKAEEGFGVVVTVTTATLRPEDADVLIGGAA